MNVTSIYDFLERHKTLRRVSLALLTALLSALVCTLRFNEDISDFLPLGTSDREALSVYQDISGANGLYIIFSNPSDADYTVEAIDEFRECVAELDSLGWCASLVTGFDLGSAELLSEYVYDNIPYFLTDADYERMDSLLRDTAYMARRMEQNRNTLMFPVGGVVSTGIARDPFGLYSPVLSSLGRADGNANFEMYGGCIFTPDMSRAVAMMSSPFGNSETEMNSRLLSLLHEAADRVQASHPLVTVHVVGGPEIAVGNSSRIKKDSILAVSLSSVLIVLLLAFSFHSLANICLILLSIAWGWLFALGGMALFTDSVSIIVIGISSVILGIAVNYPLHLIAHTAHQSDRRKALSEIIKPLLVGNITTVGAFLALVPLKSTALRDLGIFASLLLVGTMLFVLIFLPHLIKVYDNTAKKPGLVDRLSSFPVEKYRIAPVAVLLVTAVLFVFSLDTGFDSDLSNINYMTREQREDLQYFDDLRAGDTLSTVQSVYALSSGSDWDEALEENGRIQGSVDSLSRLGLIYGHRGVSQFIVSSRSQLHRLGRWNEFVQRYGGTLCRQTEVEAARCGFVDGAFDAFLSSLKTVPLEAKGMDFFAPLTELAFSGNLSQDEENGRCYVVDILDVEERNADIVRESIGGSFDVKSMNGALSDNLSDNFNYIGWACSIIVFFFLWFSFGSLELAVISFLPMALSWIWILGIMSLGGIRFNIVNIILATFIFGQGDDYTIFMTEGCQWEYAYGRKILSSYKKSILQSALIMFVGIGTLIVARHPAMKSLAEVTIIGMFSVVLMAFLIPPFLFGWMTTKNGERRRQPLSIAGLLGLVGKDAYSLVLGRYRYKGRDIHFAVRRSLKSFVPVVPDLTGKEEYRLEDNGEYGERAIYLAFTHPDTRIIATLRDTGRRTIAQKAAEKFVDNIEFI